MERRETLAHELLGRAAGFLLASAVGLCALAAAIAIGEPTKKKLVFLAATPLLPLLIAVTKQPRAVLLFCWLATLPYNRMYFSFDGIFGNNGSQGPYWVPADVFLLALLGLWLYEIVVLKRPQRPIGRSVIPWAIPFAVAGLISALGAERVNWGFFELGRMLKVAIVLIYLRYNLRPLEWWTCIGAIGFNISFQAALAFLQMALKRTTGLLSMFGGGGPDAQTVEFGLASMGGWIRAVGTIGHPSNLASYFLILVPVYLALGLTLRLPRLRLICAAVGLAGLGGLACTLSRWPWALAAGQTVALLVLLTWMHRLPARRTLGMSIVAAFLGAMALLPLTDFIYKRITSDLKDSLDFRAKDTRIALQIFSESPLTGVGLNNYSVHLLKYDPEARWAIENEDIARTAMNVRVFVALHNFYLFLLAETGLIGLVGIIFLFLGVVIIGVRAVHETRGDMQAACLGLLLGVIGVFAQGFVDFSLWVDPVLYTFVAAVALMAAAPGLHRGDETTRAAEVRS